MTLLAVAVLAPTAQATFPGANGSIAFTSERDGNPEIYSMSSTGGSETRLTTHAADDRSPAWNATGLELAFASSRDGDFEIYRMPAAGSPTPTPLTNNAVGDDSPAWAPGSAQLVIVREAGGGDTDLVILAADGSGATTPLTAAAAVSGELEPTWAPNGTRIGFSAFPPGGTQRDIFAINPDGTGLTNLTNSPARDDREPNWSPGNARITYASFHDSNYEIHVMNADGSGDSNITNYPAADDRDPAWSPDATRIAYTSDRACCNDNLFNIASTGVHAFQLTGNPASDTQPDWQRVHPPACSDGVDNDNDTLTDYPNDPGCGSSSGTDEDPICNDGQDNDGDTKVDFPDDAGCTSASDNDETNPECNDGVDNDGDTLIDYPGDPGCMSLSDNDEFNIECDDGADNDGDGFIDYPDDPGCTSTSDNDEFNEPPVYVRPRSAAELLISLVPAYFPCDTPNRIHGPPLAYPSCSPPSAESNAATQTSGRLTVGTPDSNGEPAKSVGTVRIRVVAGNPSAPPDDADVEVTLDVTDVRRGLDLTDYTGVIRLVNTLRITDRWNTVPAGGGSDPGTTVDFGGPNFNAPCAATADTTVGSTCSLTTTWDTVIPGAVREGKRSVWEFDKIRVQDGAFNQFLRQGVFAP